MDRQSLAAIAAEASMKGKAPGIFYERRGYQVQRDPVDIQWQAVITRMTSFVFYIPFL
jgi:hypothetical protein